MKQCLFRVLMIYLREATSCLWVCCSYFCWLANTDSKSNRHVVETCQKNWTEGYRVFKICDEDNVRKSHRMKPCLNHHGYWQSIPIFPNGCFLWSLCCLDFSLFLNFHLLRCVVHFGAVILHILLAQITPKMAQQTL